MVAIAAAAIAAAGAAATAGSTIYASKQQSAAAGKAAKAAGTPTNVPLPPYAAALNKDIARIYALNMGQMPPSFAQFVSSGGAAKFPFIDPGLDPKQREQLGLIGPGNQPVPFQSRQTSQQPLTMQQILFEGMRRLSKNPNRMDPISRLTRVSDNLKKLQAKDQTPQRERKEARLQGRQTHLQSKLGVSGE